MVEDDAYPVPSLGDTVGLWLAFTEDGDGDHGGADVVTVDAWAEAVDRDDRQLRGSGKRWLTVLRGDGWSARWAAARPVIGRVRVTGSFHHDPYLTSGLPVSPTYGRVERIRLAGEGSEIDVGAVQLPTTLLEDGTTAPFGVQSLRLTLDIGAAEVPEPQEPTPTWFCGFAVGRTRSPGDGVEEYVLWRADPLLPLLWRTGLREGDTRKVVVPVGIDEWGLHPRKIAGPVAGSGSGGCVVRLAGIRRLAVSEGEVGGEAAVTDVGVPVERFTDGVDDIVAAPGSRGGWIASRYSASPPVLRLGRVTAEGELTWLYEEPVDALHPSTGPVVTDTRTLVRKDGVLQYLDPDLRVVGEAALPADAVDGCAEVTAAGPWIAVHLIPRFSGSAGPEDPGRRIFLVDPDTMDVAFCEPCSSQAQVQADGRDTVWLADGSLRRFTRDRDSRGEWNSETLLEAD